MNISATELPNFIRKYYLLITRVINIQILTTNYFSFQHSVCTQRLVPRRNSCQLNVFWEHVRGSPDQCWCQLLWALWDVQICSLIQGKKSTASIIEIFCFVNSCCQPFVVCLATSLLFNRTTLLPTGASVNSRNTRLHHSSSVASQQSWP